MTKQDSQMEQHISKQQTTGKTDSDCEERPAPPRWNAPKTLSPKEELRRKYKHYYGFKPCGMSDRDLQAAVEEMERKDLAGLIRNNLYY